jgi:hypothetical protein
LDLYIQTGFNIQITSSHGNGPGPINPPNNRERKEKNRVGLDGGWKVKV